MLVPRQTAFGKFTMGQVGLTPGTREMAQGSIPSTHICQHTTVCSSHCRGSQP